MHFTSGGTHFISKVSVIFVIAKWIAEMLFMLFFVYIAV